MPTVTRSILVDTPLMTTFEVSNSIESWPDMMSEYQKAIILRHEGRKVWFRLTNETGASWVSWRMLYPPYFTYSERHEPRAPFEFMQIIWIYQALSSNRTQMTWDMTFQLPNAQRHEEDAWAKRLAEHTEVNQAKMRAYIEKFFATEHDAEDAF